MVGLILALLIFGQTPSQEGTLSPEAQRLIAPVAEAIEAEKARQAALPPPADVRERLERMGALDQVGRQAMMPIDVSVLPDAERAVAAERLWRPIAELDEDLLAELLPMVPPEGWFRKSVYGEEAASAAFLIIQHSDLEQWRRFVPILEPLVAEGEVSGQHFGLMYDRLAINDDRPQRYGTQMTCKGGRFVVDWDNLEDPANVNTRRAGVGFLQTIEEYARNFERYPPCEER